MINEKKFNDKIGKEHCGECDSEVGWYAKNNNFCALDNNLKKFIEECDELCNTIGKLTNEIESVRVCDNYYAFRRELVKIMDKAVVEAYNRKCLDWKFE